MFTQAQLEVRSLGERTVPSPLGLSTRVGDGIADYVPDGARVLLEAETVLGRSQEGSIMMEKAGPSERIYFDPKKIKVGIVTCGGLCPGLNTVIRSLFMQLHYKYGVPEIIGFRFGYEGLIPGVGLDPITLTLDMVDGIHRSGGSLLGLSRGSQDTGAMVDSLERLGISILFALGGDGTLKGAHAIAEEALRRGSKIAVVGIPKTIDNDVAFVDKTFGFETAVEVATQALDAAHTEAKGARNGIGLVKLMGRDSGFIAAQATLASREVNYCLIPEVRFQMEGEYGLLATLERRLASRNHALIVVAEGCGAALADQEVERDASGNVRYAQGGKNDIGPLMRDRITDYFKQRKIPISIKYIDPSYMIRSVPANANDSVFCDALARYAVHAGMAGKTDLMVGRRHHIFTYIPLEVATSERRTIDADGSLWLAVTEATGQPRLLDPALMENSAS